MKKPKAVTALQLTMSMGTAIIGVGILAFPRITVELANTGAPMTTVIAVAVVMVGALMVSYLGNQYPEQTLFEYADDLVGKWIGTIILFAAAWYFLGLSSLATREFGEVVVTSVLQRTPIPATVLVMLILAGIASRNDITKLVRILTFYMPLVYFPALVIVVLSLKAARLVNIMPALAVFHGIPWMHVVQSISIVSALFQNAWIIGMIIPFMYDPKRAYRSSMIGIASAGGLYIILIYAALSVFGTEEMKNLMWPTLELAKTAALPAFYIERLDPIFIAVWVTAVFCAIVTSYYLGIQALSHVFRLRDHRVLSLTVLPIVATLSSVPGNIQQLYDIIKVYGVCGLPFTLGYPLILIVVHWLRRNPRVQSRRAGTS